MLYYLELCTSDLAITSILLGIIAGYAYDREKRKKAGRSPYSSCWA